MYTIGAARHPCLAERDIAKKFDMKHFVFIQVFPEFVDNEDEEGVIIFVDQQKAFDRMEWGWLNYVMECFNFGLKFREWVYMLFKKGKTCTYVIIICHNSPKFFSLRIIIITSRITIYFLI
jgi:hypothetical protein